MSVFDENKCPNCHADNFGRFCQHCGEKKLTKKDYSLSVLLGDAWDSITELDGKWLKSLLLLITKPGQLTRDYLTGIRKYRLTPFQILLFSNVIFFLVAGQIGYSAFTTSLDVHTQSSNFIHQPLAQELVQQKIKLLGMTYSEFAEKFNQRAEIQAKSLVVIMIPLMTLLNALLNFKSRQPQLAHWVMATHVFSFLLLLLALFAPILVYLLNFIATHFIHTKHEVWYEMAYSLVLFGLLACYYYFASKKVYQGKTLSLAIGSLLFVVGVYWIFLVYRMVLFFTTFYTL